MSPSAVLCLRGRQTACGVPSRRFLWHQRNGSPRPSHTTHKPGISVPCVVRAWGSRASALRPTQGSNLFPSRPLSHNAHSYRSTSQQQIFECCSLGCDRISRPTTALPFVRKSHSFFSPSSLDASRESRPGRSGRFQGRHPGEGEKRKRRRVQWQDAEGCKQRRYKLA